MFAIPPERSWSWHASRKDRLFLAVRLILPLAPLLPVSFWGWDETESSYKEESHRSAGCSQAGIYIHWSDGQRRNITEIAINVDGKISMAIHTLPSAGRVMQNINICVKGFHMKLNCMAQICSASFSTVSGFDTLYAERSLLDIR